MFICIHPYVYTYIYIYNLNYTLYRVLFTYTYTYIVTLDPYSFLVESLVDPSIPLSVYPKKYPPLGVNHYWLDGWMCHDEGRVRARVRVRMCLCIPPGVDHHEMYGCVVGCDMLEGGGVGVSVSPSRS